MTTELIQRLKTAAQEEIMCREAGDTSDLWQDEASPENILTVLASLEAKDQCIAALEREKDELRPVGVMSEKAFYRLESRQSRFIALWPRPGIYLQRKRPEDGVIVYARTAAAVLNDDRVEFERLCVRQPLTGAERIEPHK